MNQFITIDAYIESYPAEVQAILQQVRSAVKQAAPAAKETIAYGIPAFTWNGSWFISGHSTPYRLLSNAVRH